MGEGLDQIKTANGGVEPACLRDGYAVDREAFCRVVEGLCALAEGGTGVGVPDAKLQRLAGLKPVNEVLGLP
ncbi:hypothetical protein BGM09_01415 [Streptomyces sp. CBMA29]|nr:hypothetical protein [Streptomyces sp. CBMA29]